MNKDKHRIEELENEIAKLKKEKEALEQENKNLKALAGAIGSYATIYTNGGYFFNGYSGFNYQVTDDSKTPTESELS